MCRGLTNEAEKGLKTLQGIRQTVLLAGMEIKQRLPWKQSRIFFGIVLIIILISTISYVQSRKTKGTDEKQTYVSLGISNEDTSEYSSLLVNYFSDNTRFTEYVTVIEGTEEELEDRFAAGELDCYLVIPKEFVKSLIYMDHVPIRVYVSNENATKALLLRTVLESYETYITSVEINCVALYDRMREEGFLWEQIEKANVDISMELVFTALGKDTFFTQKKLEPDGKPPWLLGVLHTTLFLIFYLICFPLGIRLQNRYQCGMFSRLKASGIPVWAQAVAMLLPYILWMGAASGLLLLSASEKTLRVYGNLFLLLMLLPLFTALLSVICKKKQTYLLLYSIGMVSFLLIGGGIISVQYLPDHLQLLSGWMPNAYLSALLWKGCAASEGYGSMLRMLLIHVALWGSLLSAMRRRGMERM